MNVKDVILADRQRKSGGNISLPIYIAYCAL